MTPLGRFQKWYAIQREVLWDNAYSTKIYSLGNPGWAIDIDLKETPTESKFFQELEMERSEHDWIFAKNAEGIFQIRCGPQNLEEALTIFCDWSES